LCLQAGIVAYHGCPPEGGRYTNSISGTASGARLTSPNFIPVTDEM